MEFSSQDLALLQKALDYICKNHVPGCNRTKETEAREFANSCKQKLKSMPAEFSLPEIETLLFAITAYAYHLSAPPRQINVDQLSRQNALPTSLYNYTELILSAIYPQSF